jgi:polyisoprenoid-binding protein YceI
MKATEILLALAVLCAVHPAHAAQWTMEPRSSELGFTVAFEGAPARGVFRSFELSMEFTAAKPAGSRIDVTIAVASADMRSSQMNDAIRGPDWFDATHFPVAEFRSLDVHPTGPDRYLAIGTLQVKGITRLVELPFEWKSDGAGAVVDGHLTLQRAAFGIGGGDWLSSNVIGPEVKVHFSVNLRKAG